MRFAGRKRHRQGLAGREQVPLPDHLSDGFGTQAVGERRRGCMGREEVRHGVVVVGATR